MKRSPWTLVALAAFTVVCLLLALLIKDRGGTSAADRVAAAPALMAETGTARVEMSVKVDTETVDAAVDGQGAVAFDTRRGWFTLEALGQEIEVRTDGRTLYVLPSGTTTWLAAKADEASSLGSVGPDVAIAFVDLLHGATKVDEVGDDRFGHHLEVTIDVDRAAKETDGAGDVGIRSLAELAKKKGSLPLDLWLDDEGHVVRERMTGVVGGGLPITITVDLSDLGSKLGVAIPPEGATRDVEGDELAQLLGATPDSG